MGKVTILPETTKHPVTKIGCRAGICWGADITNEEKNYKRGIDCLESNHGRTLEFPDIEIILDGYSARTIREYYTHIGCLPSRLQESTRYIDYRNFKFVTPQSVLRHSKAKFLYNLTMEFISKISRKLIELGIPREDVAMLLPLAMETKIVDKRNLRNFIDMSRQRKCKRAYWEFREMFNDICNALSEYSSEWEYIVRTQMKSKCDVLGYCPEKHGCGKYPKREK